MNYISLDNLTRYHSKFKDYADAKYTLARDYGWKQTEKAGAVTCWPVGESRMKPVVEFLFKETLPSGDKGPDNPSTMTGVSSVKVTRCGKNLCPLVGESSSSYISVSFTDNGEFVFNGSYVGVVNVYVFNKPNNKNLFPNYLERGKTYTFSLQGDNSSVRFDVYRYYTTNYSGQAVSIALGESRTYTIPNTQSMILRFHIPANTVLNNAKFKLQIEEGTTATAFEPYAGADYTVNLGGTYYGGTLDVASGRLTVTHRMVEADSLTLDISNYPAYLPLECTDTFGRTITSTGNILALTGSTGGKIVYKLANPYTVQIDPVAITSLPQIDKYTPRLNTLYTDAENITVKYIKSPIRDEYEKVQAIIANGGTI